MRTRNFVKSLSLFLVISIIASVIAGCDNLGQNPIDIKDIYSELKCDNELTYNAEGEFSVNISGAVEFADGIGEGNIKICYAVTDDKQMPQIDSAEGILLHENEYATIDITPLRVTVNSANSVTVYFRDLDFSKYKPSGYIFIFDTESSKDNKLLYCYAPVRYSAYSMVSDTVHIIREQTNVTLKLTLDKTGFSDKITKDYITLSGGFYSCTVQSVERTGENTLTLEMICEYTDNSQVGYITVDKSMIIDSNADVTAEIRIDSPEVIANTEMFEATFNYACIPIGLKDAVFTDVLSVDMITCSNPMIKINRIERNSSDEALVYLSMSYDTAVDAVKAISTSTFTIGEDALNINDALSFSVKPSEPNVSARILSVTENDSDFRVKAQFSVVNGSFNVVSKTSFVFGGDYSKAVVDTIQLQDNTALVEFTMPKTSSADKAELYGTVALKSSSLINDWGENNSIPAFPLSYKADERVIMSNNGALSQDDMKQLLNAIKKSALENAVWDLSTLGNITGVELDNEKTLSYYFDEINRDFVYFDNLYVNIKDSVHSSRITGKKARVIDARNKLDIFLSDIETLKAAIMSVDSALAVIAQYETADLDMLSPEELEKLTNEYNIARDKVRSAYNNRIKGSSFRELLIGLADNYMAENGALQSFDYLIDCSYNWQPQTVSEKNKFRYYVNGILAKGYIIALLSTGINYDYGAGSGEISQLRDSVSTVSDFFDSSIVSERNDGRVFCNTLGRSFSLNAYDDGTGINSLTSAQISQLVNMLPRATSLRDELLSVGFDVSDVRYLICSDGGKSNSHSSSSAIEGNLAVKTYTRTSRAMVYDLIGSVIIEDFVYENIALCLSSEGKELPTLSMIAVKNIDLYALR